MEDSFQWYSWANMPAENADDLSVANDRMKELENFLNALLIESPPEVPSLLPGTKTLTDYFIENKKCYFQQIHGNITITKNSFYNVLNKVKEDIDEMTDEIMLRAQTRKKQLQKQLREVESKQISKWNRQLFICEQILKDLDQLNGFNSLQDASALSEFLESQVNGELDFLEAGQLSLDTRNLPKLLKTIDNFGNINAGPASKASFSCAVPKFIFGSSGDGQGQFCRPWGVCADNTGRILVSDRSNHRIQIFNEFGEFLLEFGKEGSKNGEFNRPCGLTVDNKCRIIVADKDNHRVQVFTYSGHFLHSFGSMGTKLRHFMYPWDVAVNANYNIAVSDSKNHRIQLFSEKGALIAWFDAQKHRIHNARMGLKFLDSPRGLAFRPDGSLMVTDFNNHRVLVINSSFSKATMFGSEGHGPEQFFRPQGITCDSTGRFAVADCKNYRIQIFDASGKLQKAFGVFGEGSGQFDCPQGICFHPNRNLIVVDLNNNRVQVF